METGSRWLQFPAQGAETHVPLRVRTALNVSKSLMC